MYFLFNAFMNGSSGIVSVLSAKNINERYHATGVSIIDFSGRVLGAILFIVVIPFIDKPHIQYAWLALAGIFFTVMGGIFILYRINWFGKDS